MRLTVALVLACLAGALAAESFINTKIKRTIDATEHTVSIRTDYTVEVTATTSAYVFSFPVEEASHIAYLRVKLVSPTSSTLTYKKLGAMYVFLKLACTLSNSPQRRWAVCWLVEGHGVTWLPRGRPR